MADCQTELIGLLLLSLALLLSICLNVILCIKCRATFSRDDYCSSHNSEGEGLTQTDRHIHNLNHHEQQENPRNHFNEQENPIYGNISIDRTEGCYVMMTKQQTRDRNKPLDPDLNYASLDLKVAKKRKKHRHQLSQTQGRNNCQDQLLVHQNDLLEVEADMDAHLPSRDTSTMVSHSSIYLNSQQIAQETEEMGRERSTHLESDGMGWEGTRRWEDGGSRKWKGEQESENRQDDGDVIVCTQISEVSDLQSGAEAFNSNFNNDSAQQQ